MQPNGVVVCATDLSDNAPALIDAAIEIAARMGAAKLVVLHVRETPERIETVQEVVERFEARQHDLRALLDRELERTRAALAGTSVETSAEIRYGKAYREILKFAIAVKATTIVVGTHGHTGLGHAVLGSVAERVVRYAPCTVVVAKSPEVCGRLRESLAAKLEG